MRLNGGLSDFVGKIEMTAKVLQMLIVGGVIGGAKFSVDSSESGNQPADNIAKEIGNSGASGESFDAARVARIRAEIARGEYLTPRKLSITVERILREI